MAVILGMAFNRKEFENRLWEKIAGGCSEYHKARLAELLGWPNAVYIGKWDREVERLLFTELADFYHQTETTFKDRSKVLIKVQGQIQTKSDGFFKAALTALSRIAKANPKLNNTLSKKKLDKLDIMKDFLDLVTEAIKLDDDDEFIKIK